MVETSVGISLRKIATLAALAFGGIWLLFILWKLRSYQEHSKAFLSVCAETAPDLSADGRSDFCRKVQSKYFKNLESPRIPVQPGLFGAPTLPGDEGLSFFLFQNPRVFAAQTFCDFVLVSGENVEKAEPKEYLLRQAVFVFPSFERSSSSTFGNSNKARAECHQRLKTKLDVEAEPLKTDLKKAEHVIAINPVALVSKSKNEADLVIQIRLAINRERIRRLLAICPEFSDWAEFEWKRLTPKTQQHFIAQSTDPRWEDPLEAPKLFAEQRFQNRPEESMLVLGACSFPP